VGLVFPRGDRPIAVEYPGYPVITLHPIEGLEFVREAVTALGSSTELATHLFRGDRLVSALHTAGLWLHRNTFVEGVRLTCRGANPCSTPPTTPPLQRRDPPSTDCPFRT
jgi:hypothetical protein